MFKKIRKIRITEWQYLTLGEKILEIVLGLLKWGLIAAGAVVVLAIGAAILAFVVGGYLAFGVADAIADGFYDASNAYRPGDCYVRFR